MPLEIQWAKIQLPSTIRTKQSKEGVQQGFFPLIDKTPQVVQATVFRIDFQPQGDIGLSPAVVTPGKLLFRQYHEAFGNIFESLVCDGVVRFKRQ